MFIAGDMFIGEWRVKGGKKYYLWKNKKKMIIIFSMVE